MQKACDLLVEQRKKLAKHDSCGHERFQTCLSSLEDALLKLVSRSTTRLGQKMGTVELLRRLYSQLLEAFLMGQ